MKQYFIYKPTYRTKEKQDSREICKITAIKAMAKDLEISLMLKGNQAEEQKKQNEKINDLSLIDRLKIDNLNEKIEE